MLLTLFSSNFLPQRRTTVNEYSNHEIYFLRFCHTVLISLFVKLVFSDIHCIALTNVLTNFLSIHSPICCYFIHNALLLRPLLSLALILFILPTSMAYLIPQVVNFLIEVVCDGLRLLLGMCWCTNACTMDLDYDNIIIRQTYTRTHLHRALYYNRRQRLVNGKT